MTDGNLDTSENIYNTSIDVDFGEVYRIIENLPTTAIAEDYKNTKTYSVGDYVIYNTKLYVCIIAVDEPEEFDESKWKVTSIAEAKADKANTYTKSEVDTALSSKANTSDIPDVSGLATKTELNTGLEEKADKSSVYTKSESDTITDAIRNAIPDVSGLATKTELTTGLNSKADVASVYTKGIVDGLLMLKANVGYVDDNFYTKSTIDTIANLKADKSNTFTKNEVYTMVSAKADAETTYTKTEVDNLLDDKADKSTTYTKSEVDTALADKANITDLPDMSEYYDKSEVDGLLADKADTATTYTKTETDSEIDEKILAILPVDTASGSVATFDDQVPNIPLEDCTVQIQAVQAGSGTPSPDNPRAISGFDNVVVTNHGKNVIDTRNIDITIAGIHVSSDNNGLISLSGTRDTSTGWKVIKSFTDFPPGNYVFSTNSSHITCLLNYTQITSTFTVNKGDVVRLALLNISIGTDVSDTNINAQIEYGSTATPYEPFKGSTHTVPLGQTVEKGVLNLTTGELTITHKVVEARVSDMNNGEDYPGWRRCGIREVMGANLNKHFNNQIVNIGSSFSVNTTSTNDILYLNPATYGLTQTQWITTYPDLVVQILAEYATPITVQLTPEEIRTLTGTNNVYANSGNIEVKFKADIQKYIDKKTSGLDALLGG